MLHSSLLYLSEYVMHLNFDRASGGSIQKRCFDHATIIILAYTFPLQDLLSYQQFFTSIRAQALLTHLLFKVTIIYYYIS